MLAAAVASALVATLDPVSATDSQLDYPACAVNHQPVYYCCEYGSEKELYTRYNRPSGGDFDSFYEEGWHVRRRVNFPDAFFTPDSPDFHYDKPEEVCRVQRIVQPDGTLRETLQCGSDSSIENSHDGRITTNESLADDSRETSVFWTSRTSARNSNTSFPIGATCRSLMLPSGAVDTAARAACVPGTVAATFHFTTFTEAPLLTVYILYGLLVVFIVLWIPVRGSLSILLRTGSAEQSSTNGPVKSGKEGVTRLVDEHNGLVTPMLTRRNSEVELRAAADAIEQTGYADSMVGSLVKWYFYFLTISLMPIVMLIILDSNRHFSPALFDPTNDVIVVFIVTWVITAVWLTLLVTLKVQTSEDGHRYVEFQHLRYIYDELYGKFLPGGVPFPETYAQILEQSDGLVPHDVSRRLAIVGSNAIEVKMPSTAWSIVQEVFHFFYIYQAMCYYVWFFTGYWKVAVVNTVIISIVISFNIFSKRRILENVLKMTRVQGGVAVKRDGVWQTIKVSQLVPGDLVRVIQNWELPCDMVIDLATQRVFVFCKGSYEKMLEICDEQSLPSDYTHRAERLARDGCYVLGIGFKEIVAPEMRSHNAYHDRDAVEADLVLLGLIMFQNELKDDSADVIAKLKEGDLRVVMITGDNAMTGCYIARQSGIVRPGARVVLGEILAVNQQGAKALVWKDVDTLEVVPNRDVIEMAERSLAMHGMDPATMTPSALLYGDLQGKHDHWELAVTGPAFNYLRKMGDLPKLLFHIRIFSRMTPAEKTDCIAEMMAAGAVTGMCGDGGNDCGALRVAHVGVALSDTEASVVAPFTSRHKSIVSVLDVCREGRCSLSTSFANLKFLIMYGMIGCGLRFVLYGNAVFMPEYAFMYCDGLILVGLSAVISLAKPLQSLGKERPTASLVGPTTLLSVFGQEIIHIIFLYLCVNSLMTQPWYCPFNPESVDLTKWWLLQDSHLGTVLFFVISMQYVASALAYGFGSRFRRPIYRNYALVVYVLLLVGVLFYMAVAEPNDFTDRFRIASSTNVIGLPDIPMPLSFRWKLVTLIAANTATVLIYEQVFILGPVKRFLRRRLHHDALQLRL
ncbi:hypothetical protein P43SY_008458 [Pythium insidiosum]|uniref:P-type ATPase A domain-containing protein n=1 Tax=Pythium insidiosum TaxID=114742 RepID=A0AAD5QAQ6_PYTIN|nr:hypothetical protein P43SY_008458 [Pythium insidiosum]